MRARIFALFILVLLLGVPAFLYWYFLERTPSTLTLVIPGGESAHVELDGNLAYKYFPLADKVLHFSQVCTDRCTFGPIPPVPYKMTVTRDGVPDLSDTLTLRSGEAQVYTLPVVSVLVPVKIGSLTTDDSVTASLLDNAHTHIDPTLSLLGTLTGGKAYAMRSAQKKSEIGILSLERFTPLLSLDFPIRSGYLDATKRFFILEKSDTESHILTTDLSESIVFPFPDQIVSIDHTDGWRVHTDAGVYSFSRGYWESNPRFTDFIDINSTHRVGYISAADTQKKSLGNFMQKGGIFVLLDRTTTHTEVIAESQDIVGFLMYDGVPAFLDHSGDIYKLQIQ